MAEITRETIAGTLEGIGRLLELKGENVFKIRAYANAARAVEGYSGSILKAAADGALGSIPGIGKAIAEKINELIETGELEYFNTLKAEFPPGLFEMLELQGLGPKKIKAVWEKLGVTNILELEAACRDGRIAALPGFGKKTADNICAAIAARARHSGRFRLGDIAPDAEKMLEELRRHPAVAQISLAGSYRRRKEVIGDLDFIVSTNEPETVTNFFVGHAMVENVIAQGPTKASVRWKSGVQADLRVVRGPEYPFALNYFTGSKEHNIVVRSRALARGWTLNEYRLEMVSNVEGRKSKVEPAAIPEIREEADLYGALGLDYIEPELREDRGEFVAAENHTLPDLIKLENLRGTFHCHTTASDGRSTLAEMAAAAQELGLQYLGIADHSKSSFQAHGIDETRLLAQKTEIEAMNKSFANFRLFAGIECDVLKDGVLDFPDEILAQLDYVIASVHASFSMGQAEMTSRIIRAIANPHVTILGHLTGRMLLTREPYDVDIPAIIEAAAETGTLIELNASPRRLDMDWRWWPLAKAKGVKCVINPDAHHTRQLSFLWNGIGAARKGWLTRHDVVNCLPLGKIEQVLEKKRRRG
jgi:DNA polymerase (family 10)